MCFHRIRPFQAALKAQQALKTLNPKAWLVENEVRK